MENSIKNLDFHGYRTVSPSLFGATVRPALQNLLNINPTSVGKTVVLETDAATGFLTFRLQAAYTRPHYRAATTKAAAEKEWSEIKASIHRRQASLQSPVFGRDD
ncbi:MAG: hypothetical protein RI894_526 [Bacteroidota bacterium]|jgi:hypothetical protein